LGNHGMDFTPKGLSRQLSAFSCQRSSLPASS
jgi:hypothetical protein